MHLKKIAIVVSLVFLSFLLNSQKLSLDFFPIGSSAFNDTLFAPLQKDYNYFLLKQNVQNSKIKDHFKQTSNEIYYEYVALKNSGQLMYNDTLTNYLKTVFNVIVNKNNIKFKKPVRLFILRTDIPNASNSGSEIFFFNLGLITCLNSESELAAIICHEISHELKKHMFANMLHVGTIRSTKSYKKELKTTRRQKYNSYNLSKDFYYKIKAKELVNSKAYELQADSLALQLLKASPYSQGGMATALAILDSVDIKSINAPIDYRSFFNSKQIAFDENWLKDTETIDLSSNLNFSIPDSLKTHPDCEERIKKVRAYYSTNATILGSSDFDFYKDLARFEEIEILRKEKNIDKALYKTMLLLNTYKYNRYLNATFYYCLYEIYEAKKNHYLSQLVPSQNRLYPSNYNEFLTFLNQVPSSVLKIYLKEFADRSTDITSQNNYTTFVTYLIKSIDLSQKEKQELSDSFAKLNVNSALKKELQEKINPKTNK